VRHAQEGSEEGPARDDEEDGGEPAGKREVGEVKGTERMLRPLSFYMFSTTHVSVDIKAG
jgi:hypothetical protein